MWQAFRTGLLPVIRKKSRLGILVLISENQIDSKMKKNIKTTGLIALIVGCLLMSFVIPALAECPPPWLMCEEGIVGGGRDPRKPNNIECYYPVAMIRDDWPMAESYYISCLHCGEYVFGYVDYDGLCTLK